MKRDLIDLDAVLELLDLWWRYEDRYQHARGFPGVCASTRDWRASRQWDDRNGALDADVDHKLAKHVGAMVWQVADPWRTALHFLARNRATGATVWVSPRLPKDQQERAQLVSQALDMLQKLL